MTFKDALIIRLQKAEWTAKAYWDEYFDIPTHKTHNDAISSEKELSQLKWLISHHDEYVEQSKRDNKQWEKRHYEIWGRH